MLESLTIPRLLRAMYTSLGNGSGRARHALLLAAKIVLRVARRTLVGGAT
jgi:hypothetical protein